MSNKIFTCKGKKGQEFVNIHSESLKTVFHKLIPHSAFFEEECQVPLSTFKTKWRKLHLAEREGVTSPELVTFNEFLKTKFNNEITSYNKMIEQGYLDFDNVPNYYQVGDCVKLVTNDDYYSAEITEVTGGCYNDCGINQSYVLRTRYVKHTDKLDYESFNIYIQRSEIPLLIDELEAKILTTAEKEAMARRGLRALEYMNKNYTYCNLKGQIKSRCSGVTCSGRVVVDCKLFYQREDEEALECKEEIDGMNTLQTSFEGKEHLIYPFVGVYALEKKCWGLAHIDKLSPIDFLENAFDNVVMDPERKMIIKKIVKSSGDNKFKDLVINKNGGLIFLLHGSPGLGKTLIAESTSEFLKVPLLQLTAGELGVYPDEIETTLQTKFNLAKRWNAIVLIDEADVFMEQRDCLDIKRNCMVTIFLRMLERFEGILFLTTNRGNNIDIAIKSRLSVILDYKPFTKEERLQVWKNLLSNQTKDKFNLSNEDLNELSIIELNGREIKHCIKMSMALSDGVITIKDIKAILKYIH